MKDLVTEIRQLVAEKNAVIMAHYYQRPEIQDVADYIGDSLALAQQATRTNANIIVMCGVHFMAETAAILCPDKKVLIPDPTAGCSLADSCDAIQLKLWKEQHPDYKVVSYVNTTAAVKALSDVVVTSSNALSIVNHFAPDEKLLFGPDKNLGTYINQQTGRNMALWNGGCHVHGRFSADALKQLREQYPGVPVLAHPECGETILAQSDVIGSTQALINYVATHPELSKFIIATESGVIHKMQEAHPTATFIPVPPMSQVGQNKTCCNECEYMRQITLEKLYSCLRDESGEVKISEDDIEQALLPIRKMLDWSK